MAFFVCVCAKLKTTFVCGEWWAVNDEQLHSSEPFHVIQFKLPAVTFQLTNCYFIVCHLPTLFLIEDKTKDGTSLCDATMYKLEYFPWMFQPHYIMSRVFFAASTIGVWKPFFLLKMEIVKWYKTVYVVHGVAFNAQITSEIREIRNHFLFQFLLLFFTF